MKKITDNQKEQFAVVNRLGKTIGQASRKECHQNPKLVHQAICLLIVNNKGKILLQKRSTTKDLYPGYLTLSTTGHVDLKENSLNTVLREAKEELNITLNEEDLIFVKKMLVKALTETELVSYYFCKYNSVIKAKNKNEIERLFWVNYQDLIKLIKENEDKFTPCSANFLKIKENQLSVKKLIDKIKL